MIESLFTPLIASGLTTLRLQHDWRDNTFRLCAAREWDHDREFATYQREFTALDLLTDRFELLDTDGVRRLYDEHGLSEYLETVLELMAQGRHAAIEAYVHVERDIRFMCHQHHRGRGLRNRRQAILAGGIRRHSPEEDELNVIIDGLNLGRAMSFKNIAADLDFGGCKTTVQMHPLDLEDMESLGFLAFAIDRSRTMTGPDMNFPTAMSDVINEHFSMQFTNGPSSPLGESGVPTAYGTLLALQTAIEVTEGDRADLTGKRVAIMGLGAVGWHLAEGLVDAGAELRIADLDTARLDAFVAAHEGSAIEIIAVDDVLSADVDVVCLAAIGGIIDDSAIDRIRARYVFGPANNQLAATSQVEEERLARRLADRGIVFQVEWWHNTAGVMCGAEEYLSGSQASPDTLRERIERTIPEKTRRNLEDAARRGVTPTENAYRQCVEALYGDVR